MVMSLWKKLKWEVTKFANLYGSLEGSIPFPFLRLSQIQIPFGEWLLSYCTVLGLRPSELLSCTGLICNQDKLIWPPTVATLNLSRGSKRPDIVRVHCPCQVPHPTVPTEQGLPLSFPIPQPPELASLPTNSACPCSPPKHSLRLKSVKTHFCCLHQPFLNLNLIDKFQILYQNLDSNIFT